MEHKLLSSAEQLQVLLFSISDNVMLPKLRCWLAEGLIPHLLNSDQSRAMIATLAHWIESRAMDLEVTDKSGWPKNAVELCQVLNCGVDGTVFQRSYARGVCCSSGWTDCTTTETARCRHGSFVRSFGSSSYSRS
jgi:hypothetical protein